MKAYLFEGKEYVFSHEATLKRGNIFVSRTSGEPLRASIDEIVGTVQILKLKENMETEYQIPCLKISMYGGSSNEDGKVFMMRVNRQGYYERADKPNWSCDRSCVIPWPTLDQVAKDKIRWLELYSPKKAALPASIQTALSAPNANVCAGAREWAKGLMEAVMAEIQKVEA